MTSDWYERAFELVREAQGEDVAAFMLHTLENGDVRVVGLELPPAMVAWMLRSAASGYEAQVAPQTVN
jgi:hypothetical protein